MKNKGITLVALVITIIILLILAGITIAQLTGSGLFENAKLAKEKSDEAQEKEESTLSDYENKIGQYIDSSRDTITMTTEQLEELMNNKVNEKMKVTTLSSEGITFNEEYIDSTASSTYVQMQRSGNMVILNFSLKIKKNIPNSETVVFSGIPKARANVFFLATTTYADVFTVRCHVIGSNIKFHWAGREISTQNDKNTVEGHVVYFTNE